MDNRSTELSQCHSLYTTVLMEMVLPGRRAAILCRSSRAMSLFDLGNRDPIAPDIMSNPNLYLGVRIDRGEELRPRLKIGATLRTQWGASRRTRQERRWTRHQWWLGGHRSDGAPVRTACEWHITGPGNLRCDR